MKTKNKIKQLKQEATQAGDKVLVAYCDWALSGDRMALLVCSQAFAYARKKIDK